jgi:hypothetical protein
MSSAPKPSLSPSTHTPYLSRDLSTKSEAYKATLEIMFCHMADMFEVVVDIIAEKYGHSKEEMIAAVKTHPAFEALKTHPVIDGLNYITDAELPVTATATATATAPPAPPAVAGAGVPDATPLPKKKPVIRKKKVVAPEPAATNE